MRVATRLGLCLLNKVNTKLTAASERFISSDIVKIVQGKLRGTIHDIPKYGSFASFKGIPYAKPPTGDLRFKAPLPPDNWLGVRDASQHGAVCPQIDMYGGGVIEGDENCLFLNVYTPLVEGKIKNNIPVIIFFHGGAYFSGSGDSDNYGPEYMMTQNVILVTVNYRLEVLGFLCLGSEDIPGNAGIKDQVAAMRWVKQNISSFGGDANNITIYGESVGGSSATYHMFSPMCKELYHKVIAHSGVCINDFANGAKAIQRAFRLGKYLGKDTKDPNELAKFLRSIPAVDLTRVTFSTQTSDEKRRGLPIRFTPVIEKEFCNQEAYLSKPIIDMIENGDYNHVPLVLLYNSNEGIGFLNHHMKKMDEINKDFERFVPNELASICSLKKSLELGEKIKRFYFGESDFSKSTIENMTLLQSDFTIVYGVYRFSKLMMKTSRSPIYLGRFSYDNKLNMMKALHGYTGKIKGACHADDLFYAFKSNIINEDLDSMTEIGQLILQFVQLITNVAKFGNPTPQLDGINLPKWEPLSNNKDIEYYNIDNKLGMTSNLEKDRMEFWDLVYDEAYKEHTLKNTASCDQ